MIPHPRMERRNFVLVPLREIAPHVVHPLLHERIEDLAERTEDRAAIRRIGTRPAGKPSGRPAARYSRPKGTVHASGRIH